MTRPHAAAEAVTYILPIKQEEPGDDEEFAAHLRWLDERTQLIVVDGSSPEAFADHTRTWPVSMLLRPDPALRTTNGKVWGVLTGLSAASHDKVIVADDDVRYDETSLVRVTSLLDRAEVVRPQNYFSPAPWHARWDAARSLLNRVTGGDWPGTLALRRSALPHGYDGDCLFENLELVRTIKAAGGREGVPPDLYVRRLPPTTRHFLSQRVRQAYDEWARPLRFAVQLALLPAFVSAVASRNRWVIGALAIAPVLLAEAGRRRAGASKYFSVGSSLMAPLWVGERMVCAWLALGMRLLRGGVIYHGSVIARPATPVRELRRRLEGRDLQMKTCR